jgi:hypothetical protein
VVINSSGSVTLDSWTFDNTKTTTWVGGNISTRNGAYFNNEKGATFTIMSDATFDSTSGQQGTFQNEGTVRKVLTNGTTTFNTLFNNNGGKVDVPSGTLSTNGGGTATGSFTVEANGTLDLANGIYTLEPTSGVRGVGTVEFGTTGFFGGTGGTTNVEGTFTPATTVIIGGTVNFVHNLSLANLTMSGGTLTGASTVTIIGPFNWTGGTMAGSGTTVAVGGLFIDTTTGGNPGVSTRTFKNKGAGTMNGGSGGNFAVSNGGTFDNAAGGSLAVQGSLTFSPAFFQGAASVSNEGTLTLSGSGNSLRIQSETFTTNGIVNLGGNSMTTSGTYTQTGGITNLQGGTLNAGGLGLILHNTASLLGPGTVNGNLTNSGFVDAGSSGSPGQLTINGNYTQGGSGTLDVQLGGTSPGSGGYDQLVVNGSVALDGTLIVTLVNGYLPQSGQQFQILVSNSESGPFATKQFPSGTDFQTTYSSRGVILTAS